MDVGIQNETENHNGGPLEGSETADSTYSTNASKANKDSMSTEETKQQKNLQFFRSTMNGKRRSFRMSIKVVARPHNFKLRQGWPFEVRERRG